MQIIIFIGKWEVHKIQGSYTFCKSMDLCNFQVWISVEKNIAIIQFSKI